MVRTQQDWTPAEWAIYNAMQEVEKGDAHTLMTDAVILLSQTLDKVGEYEKLKHQSEKV